MLATASQRSGLVYVGLGRDRVIADRGGHAGRRGSGETDALERTNSVNL